MLEESITHLDEGWRAHIERELAQPYMHTLAQFLEDEERRGSIIYPPQPQRLNAFLYTPFDEIKVVIVGHDPYHGEGQAHGLSFSVPEGVKIPPSLRNIYKELSRDMGMNIPFSGNLESWAKQGVLLLNASLTVRAGEANSHSKKGWLKFTQACIARINQSREEVVFLAWGRFAHDICATIDTERHCVIKTSHPSPLGASKSGKAFDAFLGSGCFTRANDYLRSRGKSGINWASVEEEAA